jgi:putative acyl-CoA dehydrogenase
MTTHEVFNQPPALENYDLYETDAALREALEREGAAWGEKRLREYGALAGSELLALGFQANSNAPLLHTHDRHGRRRDEVEYHPAYHRVLATAVAHELHALPWREPRPGAHVLRSALCYLHGQVEAGTFCPLSMAYAAVPTLRAEPAIAELWEPRLFSTEYDPGSAPVEDKSGVLLGMGMTEKQGGSDVRSNTTQARPCGAPGATREYELVGHKWFLSAPMSDAFLVLAQADRGLSCFLLPRWRPDGSRNGIRLQRLKDKLGNRSNASSEVEFDGAWALMIGEEGRGVRTIIEMVALTRLDCMTQSSALMRQAVAQATHHAAHREAFGKRLVDQPLMQNVLADLALEAEAALNLTLRVARAVEEGQQDEQAARLARLATPVAKYWICKRAPMHVNEAQECLGGAGYVEESILPRLYREAPLLSIWEGCGNIQCLDVLRAVLGQPETLAIFLDEVRLASGGDRRLDAAVRALEAELGDGTALEYRARRIVGRMALLLQASLLVRAGNAQVSDAFCARLDPDAGGMLGTLPAGFDARAIAERARPLLDS